MPEGECTDCACTRQQVSAVTINIKWSRHCAHHLKPGLHHAVRQLDSYSPRGETERQYVGAVPACYTLSEVDDLLDLVNTLAQHGARQ